jgi:hypothetical protein
MPGRMPLTVTGPDAQGVVTVRQAPPGGSYTIPETGTTLSGMAAMDEHLTARQGHPNAGAWEIAASVGFKRADWDCRVHAATRFSSTETDFTVEETLEAFEHDVSRFRRSKTTIIPRDMI